MRQTAASVGSSKQAKGPRPEWDQIHRVRHGIGFRLASLLRTDLPWARPAGILLLVLCAAALAGMWLVQRSYPYVNPQEAPELAVARAEFASNQMDQELQARIRALDLAGRTAFFRRNRQLNQLGLLAALSATLGILLLRLAADTARTRPTAALLPRSTEAAKTRTDGAGPAIAGGGDTGVSALPDPPQMDATFWESLQGPDPAGPSRLIPALNAIQNHCNYLPEPAIERLREILGISRAHVDGVISFYDRFRLQPCGRTRLKVCVGTACHTAGAGRLLDLTRRKLGIPHGGDTAPDRSVTIEEVACLGCCLLAPAAEVGGRIIGPADVPQILEGIAQTGESGDGEQPAGVEATPATPPAATLALCHCSSCRACGSQAVAAALAQVVRERRLPVAVEATTCTGQSHLAPVVHVRRNGREVARYRNVAPEQAALVLRGIAPPAGMIEKIACWSSDVVAALGSTTIPEPVAVRLEDREPATQRIAAAGSEQGNPLDLDQYRARGGLCALDKAAADFDPERIIDLIVASGLRGRGGAGYPTGAKWRAVRGAHGMPWVVCNGDEGDPGAFMDRMLLESFPFRVLEGMAIAALAVGAVEGIVYIRSEYPLALRRMRAAIEQLQAAADSGFSANGEGEGFRVRVVSGAGAFVCGEETALIASLEGRRGEPRQRPPYPSESGLWGRPTLINNVETFCCVPWILLHGAGAFRAAAAGPAHSAGTKTFALAGKVRRPGLIEVPVGTTIREIVERIGGGVPDGHVFKAVQIGGPSGGCLPAALADTPVDFDSLQATGSMMGSGGMVVLDDTDCMVDVARYFLEFATRESCGKCAPCRVGTRRMLDLLTRICEGKGRAGDLVELEELAELTRGSSLCGLGRTAPNPLLSTLRHFRHEYLAHLEGHCPSGVCKALIRYVVTERCVGCTICAEGCPVNAIPFTPHATHWIDAAMCIRCDSCRRACPENAIEIHRAEQHGVPHTGAGAVMDFSQRRSLRA